jgi:hypothetical protein
MQEPIALRLRAAEALGHEVDVALPADAPFDLDELAADLDDAAGDAPAGDTGTVR